MLEREVMQKCVKIFENLGWDVRTEVFFELGRGGRHNPYVFDIVLWYKGEIYGAVEVINRSNLKEEARRITAVLEYAMTHIKPKIFVITNGFAFDVYHGDKFYATLSAPPAPEIVDIVLGGENNE